MDEAPDFAIRTPDTALIWRTSHVGTASDQHGYGHLTVPLTTAVRDREIFDLSDYLPGVEGPCQAYQTVELQDGRRRLHIISITSIPWRVTDAAKLDAFLHPPPPPEPAAPVPDAQSAEAETGSKRPIGAD